MPVPEFNEIKLPALEFFLDGQPHHITEVYKALAKHFNLSDADLSQLLPSGTQSRWHNRASWACYDLYRAGLFNRLKRGTYQITEDGRKVAAEKPPAIDREYLMRFPQFAQFVESKGKTKSDRRDGETNATAGLVTSSQTPEEQIETAFTELRETLVADLLARIATTDPFRFEQVVLDLLLAIDRKTTRLNSSHLVISYAVFCLKKNKKHTRTSDLAGPNYLWLAAPTSDTTV